MAAGSDSQDPFLARLRADLGDSRRRKLGELAVARGWIAREALDGLLRDAPDARRLEALLAERAGLRPLQLDELREELDGPSFGPAREAGASRYEVGEAIGEGAVSVVHRGMDRELGRPVALKFLRESLAADERVRERFHREAQSLAKMDHPHVLKVHDAGRKDGRLFLVMELIDGSSLTRIIQKEPPGSRALLALLEQAARGVQHAHERGIVHRDLKPDNILVTAQGVAKVADFGLAQVVESATLLTHTGTVLGTPMYMAPEQVRGRREITVRTDVYALGAILYQLLTGRPPHQADTLTKIYDKILHEDPVPPRRLDPAASGELEAVALKAIEKDPTHRYASAGEFADELRRALAGEPVLARPVPSVVRALRRFARSSAFLPAAATVVLLASVGGFLWVRERDRADEESRRERAAHALELARAQLDRAQDPKLDAAAVSAAVDQAGLAVDLALGAAPRLALAHYRRGEVREAQGWYEAAAASYREAARLDPRSGFAHYRLGRVLLWQGYLSSLNMWTVPDPKERERAEAIAREGIAEIEAARAEGSGFDDDLRREIGKAMLAYLKRDADEVHRVCGEAIRKFGQREGVEEFHWLEGLVERSGTAARKSFDAALALRPRFVLAIYSRAWVGGDAFRSYDDILRFAPGISEAYIFRASELVLGRNDPQAAMADFDELLRRGVHLAPAYNGRSLCRLRLKDYNGAIADATEAIRLHPEGYHLPYLHRSEARLLQGDAAGALADAAKAGEIEKGEGHKSCLALRGRAKAALGDRAGAIEDLKKAGSAGAPWLKELEGK